MVYLEKFGSKDFQQLIQWVNNEELMIQFAGTRVFRFPLTSEDLEQYISDEQRHAYTIVDSNTKGVVGHAEIYMKPNQTVLLCRILIGDKNKRGQGIGQQVIPELCRIAIDELNAKLVELNVYDWNTSAIRCYEKSGFVLNPGVYNDVEMKGQIWRSLNMILQK